MTHSTELERTIVPRGRVRDRTDAPLPTGNARALAGAVAPRASAPRRAAARRCDAGPSSPEVIPDGIDASTTEKPGRRVTYGSGLFVCAGQRQHWTTRHRK